MKPVIGERMPEQITRLGGGLMNDTFKVSSRGESWVLRVFSQGAEVVAKEAALLEMVKGHVPVAAPVHVDLGSAYTISPFIAGDRLVDTLHAATTAQQLGHTAGQTLGRIHHFSFNAIGFFDANLDVPKPLGGVGEVWRSYLATCLFEGRSGQRMGEDLLAHTWKFVGENGSRLDALDDDYRLIHADYKPTNLLVADGQISAVLDWEFAWSGCKLFDIGQLFRWEHRYPPDFHQGFEAGYREEQDLPHDWLALARALDLLNLVGFLDDAEDRPVLFSDVLTLIQRQLESTL